MMFDDISESKLSCHLLRVQPLQTVRHGILRTNSLAQNPFGQDYVKSLTNLNTHNWI